MSRFSTAITTCITEDPEEAAAYVRNGDIAAFPTETVYGLGGSVFDASAVAAIFQAKERPADNPLIAHISNLNQIQSLTTGISATAQKLIEAFFPGPLTVILPKLDSIPDIVSAGLDTIAVRMPAHPIAMSFLQACDCPVAAPSANRSGRPSPTTWEDVHTDLKGRIPCILKGGVSEVGLESTVVDCSSETPMILRAGGITLETLQSIVPATILATTPTDGLVRSPGMKYRHYAPLANVHLVFDLDFMPSPEHAYIGINTHPFPEQLGMHQVCSDVAHYAHELFRFFRRCDRAGIQHIYCQTVQKTGLGLALMDRLEKAAAR